jgi:16S rRNA (adenine1518-N6/adenine1519-N6)-dimethyltransferase
VVEPDASQKGDSPQTIQAPQRDSPLLETIPEAASSGVPETQTLSFLLRRFREAGIKLRTQLGQNFLIDLNLVRLLVRSAQLGSNDVVLEIGTGVGSVAALAAADAAAVVTVEVDRNLFQLAGEELHQFTNVRMLNTDALQNKNRLNPEVLEAVRRELSVSPDRRLKLLANLPYHVATPILTNLLLTDTPPRTMTVTIQKELADRIVARPGTKEYGAVSLWIQSQCRVEILRVLPPTVFWPRPKVHSAIIHIELDDALRERIPDRPFFHHFIRSMFLYRRKILRSQLASATQEYLAKADVDRILAELHLDPGARAEQLDVKTMLALAEAVRARFLGLGS